MSHLDNEIKKDIDKIESTSITDKNIKNNKKKTIIFLIIFSIICIGITSFAIFYKKSNSNILTIKNEIAEVQVVDEKQKEFEQDESGVENLLQTYNCNDLEIVTQYYNDYEVIIQDVKNLYVKYLEIKGLKDKKIEEKINNEIKDKSFEILEKSKKYIEDPNVDSIGVNVYCCANFSNIISIKLDTNISYKEYDYESSYPEKTIGLNYNLVTGEKIEFKDLFTNTASVKSILNEVAYSTFIFEYQYDEDENYTKDLSKVDYSEIEDRILRIMQCYNSNELVEFYFTEDYIDVSIANENFYIYMNSIYKDIAIYNRFAKADDLYDGKYKGRKNLFVFRSWGVDDYYYAQIEQKSDNFFVSACLGNCNDGNSRTKNSYKEKEVLELYKTELNEIIKECEEYSKSNSDKIIMLFVNLYVDDETKYYTEEGLQNNKVEFRLKIEKLITSKEKYNIEQLLEYSSNLCYLYLPEDIYDDCIIEEKNITRFYENDLSKYYIYDDSTYNDLVNAYERTGEHVYDAKNHKEILPE